MMEGQDRCAIPATMPPGKAGGVHPGTARAAAMRQGPARRAGPAHWLPGALALAGLAGCAAPPLAAGPGAACPAGMAPGVVLTAYFGRGSPAGERVGDAAWEDFLRRDLLPLLGRGAGSTVTDAAGTWHGGAERTKVLTLIAPPARATAWRQALAAAIAVYRERFDQQAVGVTLAAACTEGFSVPG
jgi:hypothetical protein